MARPPKNNGGEKRDVILRVRLTTNEQHEIKSQAKACGIRNVSDYVRVKTIGIEPRQTPVFPDRELLIKILAHIGKIGSNANQMAHVLNLRELSGEKIGVTSERVKQTLDEIDNLTKQILEILKHGHFRKNQR